MPHGDSVAIGQTDFITCFDLLPIDCSEVLILVVAQHCFFGAIRKRGNGDAAMLATHIAIIRCNLDCGL